MTCEGPYKLFADATYTDEELLELHRVALAEVMRSNRKRVKIGNREVEFADSASARKDIRDTIDWLEDRIAKKSRRGGLTKRGVRFRRPGRCG